MTAVVKTLVPARPVGKELLLATNIPFLDRDIPDAFSTCFQQDYKPFSSKRAECVSRPSPAQVEHKDVRYIKECLTEAMVSYPRHPRPQLTRTPGWTMCRTSIKMPIDPKEAAFLTTQSQKFQPQPFQPPPAPIRQTLALKTTQQVEKLPESTNKALFIPHHCSPVVRATVKHLEEGFPTIKGDGRHRSFVSQYNDTFLGARGRAAQPVEQHSSLAIGDPVNIVERETTHAASFTQPIMCRQPVIKEYLKLNLRNFSEDSWSSTTREAFCYRKMEDRVVLTKRNKNSSSLPEGDTDVRRNKERTSVTTNRIAFSDLNLSERPVHVHGPDLMTKSHVQFSPPCLSGMYYTTTAKEHYSKQSGERARKAIQLPSNILRGQECELALSTTKADYLPLKACRQTPCLSQQMSHIRFPLARQHFSTTQSEDYTIKPLNLQHPHCSKPISHFVVQ